MSLDRRSLLHGLGAAGLLAGAAAPTVGATQTIRLRKPISTLSTSDPDVEAMRRAIPLMRQSGAWADQVALHADMRHRHHSSWRFMPWHRLQLVWFERHIARLSGKADFAIPYWDWDDDRIPDLFLYDEPFYIPGREAQQYDTISEFLRRNRQVLTGRLTDDFPTFFGRPRGRTDPTDSALGRRYYSGSGEWGGHNLIHGFVGGDMGDLSRSANDPLFWLHHANIDRIYAMWRDRHYSQVPPKAWRTESLGGFIDPWGRSVAPVSAESTLDTTAFGYAYPQDPTPPVFFAAAPPPPVKRRKSYSWRMQRMGPASAFIEISPTLANAMATEATGYLEIQPDPHRPSMVTLTGRALKGGAEVFRDAVFLVPMGHSMGPQGYRIPMQRLWSSAVAGGVRLEIEAAPLAGRQASQMPTTLVDFVLDADLAFLA